MNPSATAQPRTSQQQQPSSPPVSSTQQLPLTQKSPLTPKEPPSPYWALANQTRGMEIALIPPDRAHLIRTLVDWMFNSMNDGLHVPRDVNYHVVRNKAVQLIGWMCQHM